MIENVLIYLVGFAGTGKLTVAAQLAASIGAKVVDNHWINNPIFGLFDNDRTTPYPEAVWEQVDKVRHAVLDTVASLCAPTANFIMTHAGYQDEPEDWKIYHAVENAAARRRATFVPVRLLCDEEELARRVTSPERALRLKSMDAAAARRDARTRTVLDPPPAGTLTLDISALGAAAAAGLILDHMKSLVP